VPSGRLSDWSRRLGHALVSNGFITEDDVNELTAWAINSKCSLGKILIDRGLVSDDIVLKTLSELSQLPSIPSNNFRPAPEALMSLPKTTCQELKVVGYSISGNTLTVAAPEPLSASDKAALVAATNREIACVLANEDLVEGVINMMDDYANLASAQSPAPPVPTQPAAPAPSVPTAPQAPAPPVPTQPAAPQAPAPPVPTQPAAPAPSAPQKLVRPSEPTVPVMKDINDLLVYAVEHGSSDLHLTNRLPPSIRVDGSIRPIPNQPPLDNEVIREMIYGIITQGLRERFEANKELDTSHAILGVGRFRVNVFQQRGSIGAVLRTIPHDIPPFESLGLPDSVKRVTELRRGLVLVTGPTGSGKSTTLASIINIINQTRPLHIVTVEDPIEFLHSHGRSIVNQREVGTDTKSFNEALRHVLRQDPDVILVGEMRDLETISTALTAAETGHLVFATLHTQDAPQTVDRIIDVFPTNQQDQVRVQLAGSLEAVITQQLVVTASGVGRVAIAEVMFSTPAIRNLIRSAKTHQIYSLMQTGAAQGMQTMDQGLAKAVKAGMISEGVAYDRCHDEAELRDYLRSGNV
jgi:twitching motility protein PilT